MKRYAIAVTLLAIFSAASLACMGTPPKEATIEELLKEGKKNLEDKNNGSRAYNNFHDVLDREPDNKEALYGITMALDLRVFAFIDGTIDLINGPIIENPTKEKCAQACQRIDQCNLYRETWTTPDNCMTHCPFGLQPFMFDTLTDGSTCKRIRDYGLDWITPTTPDRCVELCNDFNKCGLIHPPVTFDVPECISHCPWSYVHHHEKFYKVGKCNGYDRTAFEHVTTGLQVLFREIGIYIPPQTMVYTDKLLKMNTDYEYTLRAYAWTLVDPPLYWNLSGRDSYAELHMSRALAHLFETFVLLATSVNLEMNFPSFDLNMNYSAPQGIEILHNLIRVVEILLYDPIFPLGFQIKNEDFAFKQIKEGATEFGAFWESLGDMFEYLFQDTDVQKGRAVGYNDDNNNFHWDEDETITFRIGDAGLDLTKPQCEALVVLARALQKNFDDRTPFDVTLLTDFLNASNLGDLDFLIDLIASWFPDGTVDLSWPLYEPYQNDFRDLLVVLLDKMREIEDILIANGVT
jgi:hypothetical protein